VSFVLHYSVCI